MNWHEPIDQVVGDFNPLKFDWIRELTLMFQRECDNRLDIDVFVAYGSRHLILFRICNAKQVRIGDIDHSLLQLGELFIDSLEGSGLEGLNYRIHDELGGLSCYCEQLEVIKIVELDRAGSENIVWSKTL